ncbi:acyl transferase/acyl hydrolase/lysophospholipase [Boletus edulis]|nr:acyl transferase/acyl hydrolase/lysophospholipase [Boletus edulis]
MASIVGNTISLWDPCTSTRISSDIQHSPQPWSIAISRDNRWLATGHGSGVTLRNLEFILPDYYFVDQEPVGDRADFERQIEALRDHIRLLNSRLVQITPRVPDGTYRIKCNTGDLYLTRPQDGAATVVVRPLNQPDASQRWTVSVVANGTYHILMASNSKAPLSVGIRNALVTGRRSTTWTFEPRGDAYVIGNAANAAAIQLAPNNQSVSVFPRNSLHFVHNVLSIDGCGFRGLTQLRVLEELMKQHSKDTDNPSLPCDVFDLICGTATGGLIAILLGRLQMSCEEAIKAYGELEHEIFDKTPTIQHILAHTDPFNTDRFRKRLEEIIVRTRVDDSNLPVNAPMLADAAHNRRCRTLVTVLPTSTAVDADADRIRSYERLADPVTTPERRWSIRDAALGTASCPRLFSPFELGAFGFMAANTSGLSNPSMIAYLEAQDIWGKDAELTLISLGMGLRERHDYGTLSKSKIEEMIGNLGVVVTSEDERLRRLISHTQLVATSTQVKHLRLQVLIDRNSKQNYMRLDPYRNNRDHLTFVDYVQQPNVHSIVDDFIQGYPERFDKAVDFVQGVHSKWIKVQGYTCDIGQTVQWKPKPPQDISKMSLGQIMRECLLWEKGDGNRPFISCFAVKMDRASNKVMEVEMKTGRIQLDANPDANDDDKVLFVRVLLDDQWRFFPQCRAYNWVDESTENPNETKDPIDAIQYVRKLTNFQEIKAFRSDGQYTTLDVNREEVNIYETNFNFPYHGTWVRTSMA